MSAMLPTESKSPSRRALLAGALGGLGALVAGAVSRANPARAADGDPVYVGSAHTAETVTTITGGNTDVFVAESTALGVGVRGRSHEYIGVWGVSDLDRGVVGGSSQGVGVLGRSHANIDVGSGDKAGVIGEGVPSSGTASVGVWGRSSNNVGVYGTSQSSNAVSGVSTTGNGVFGQGTIGVYGYSGEGRAVQGATTTGYAGYFAGKVFTNKFYELLEIGTPAAAPVNRARLFVRDSGGKTQLCVRFHTGAVKVLATET